MLTNEESCSIIAKHLRETSGSESLEGVKNRTLKIKQRRDKKEPDKIQKEFYLYSYLKDTNSDCELVFERAKVLEMIRAFLRKRINTIVLRV